MQVINKRKLLPDVTIGLTKKEAAKLAKVLKESNVSVLFGLEILTDLDFIELTDIIAGEG
ncbi:MAG: hypothetical protein D8M57_05250 [Candidatus Scalindua sp. AMX11]|nr:MAG: hypothetical protein DWQ00_07535 [Candidatus Scalindua sp.]NOG85978.1 hypothetical protein [Planctomycetota bacterium]RZV91391.1 MAG: hypothetical protein EX341_05530 [Candidatus Scalindua sp. SCAELEC01]TDE65947.1 MAG: hypothetical protein D8M57_05250 [Candidatus Scalindua sp. AMX11]GJQ59255.1 MAG: hypothetical protein SCALA701_20560 [Candidatus Scalindua sp.]